MKDIDSLLSEMTIEQKAPIVKIFGLKTNDNKSIIEKLSKVLLPVGGLFQTPLNYSQFIEKIAIHHNEKPDYSLGLVSAEKELYIKLFQQEFEKLTPEEKANIMSELEKAGLDKSQISSLSGISVIGAAQLSGFGVYLLASTTVGAITSLLGITLPFVFYTGMSSLISFVIGPVGFLVMGVMLYRSFKKVKSWDEALEILKNSWQEIKKIAIGDYARATLAFKYLTATRIILIENHKENIIIGISEIEKMKIIIQSLDNESKVFIEDKEIKKHQEDEIQSEISLKQEEINTLNKEKSNIVNSILNIDSEINKKNKEVENRKEEITEYENDNKVSQSKINKLLNLSD